MGAVNFVHPQTARQVNRTLSLKFLGKVDLPFSNSENLEMSNILCCIFSYYQWQILSIVTINTSSNWLWLYTPTSIFCASVLRMFESGRSWCTWRITHSLHGGIYRDFTASLTALLIWQWDLSLLKLTYHDSNSPAWMQLEFPNL